jgi:hypothetical protein
MLIDELIELRKPALEANVPYKVAFASYLTKCIKDDYDTVSTMFKEEVKKTPHNFSISITRNYSVPDELSNTMDIFFTDHTFMKQFNSTIAHTIYPGITICTLEHMEPVKVWSSKLSFSVDVLYRLDFTYTY